METEDKKEIESLREEIERQKGKLLNFWRVMEGMVLLIAQISILNDPISRLTNVIKATRTFPEPYIQAIMRHIITFAGKKNIRFEDLSESLLKGLGDRAKELVPQMVIGNIYGPQTIKRWQKMVGGSNPSTTTDDILEEEQIQ